MSNRILVFYGSYRSDRMGIRLAQFVVERLRRRGDDVELIDAKAVNLPMLDRMYKEYPKGQAPEPLEQLAGKIRDADGFVFVTGEYNWGIQPGLKNLTDHFLEEWFWRPAAIVSYSAGRFSGARAATAWHGTLSEMGMVVVSSTIAVGPIGQTLSAEGEPDRRRAARPLNGRSRALPTISCGGWKRRRRSDSASRRRIDREQVIPSWLGATAPRPILPLVQVGAGDTETARCTPRQIGRWDHAVPGDRAFAEPVTPACLRDNRPEAVKYESAHDPGSSRRSSQSPLASCLPCAPSPGARHADQIEHHIAKIDGIRFHYVTAGTGDPVLLLPGWPESWIAWRKVLPLLVSAGRRVVLLDPRGQAG